MNKEYIISRLIAGDGETRAVAESAAENPLLYRIALICGSKDLTKSVLFFESDGKDPEKFENGAEFTTEESGKIKFVPYDTAPLYDGGTVYLIEESVYGRLYDEIFGKKKANGRRGGRFNMITLDAKKLSEKIAPDGSLRLDFRLGKDGDAEGTASPEIRYYTDSVNAAENTALFYQLVRLLPELNPAACSGDPADILRDTLIYVDFSGAEIGDFRYVIENGIDIEFDMPAGNVTFVPFLKSASMSRHSVLTFVDRGIRDKIEKRLMLGMKIENAVLSKLYAYTGLYLSAAARAEIPGIFNEKSVIVIDDDSGYKDIRPELFLSAEKKNDGSAYSNWVLQTGRDSTYYDPQRDMVKLPINRFDGEGLVLPCVAEQINEAIGTNGATSFQIRMPFTKGMLHTVDFLKFFKNETGIDTENAVITDAYGIKRDLRDVCVILTKSMFKGFSWLKNHAAGEDPVAYFFRMIKIYGHSLYIGNTDKNYRTDGTVLLNYQFLSTLDLTRNEFGSILEGALKSVDETEKTIIERFRESGDGICAENTDEEADEAGVPTFKTDSPNLRAAAANKGFLADIKTQNYLKSLRYSAAKDIARGRLPVSGDLKLLSGDLFVLMLHAAKKITDADKDRITKLEQKNKLDSHRFFMPGKPLPADNTICAVLRNPHLSRSEQIALARYIPGEKNERDRIYKEYFADLTGVVMLPYNTPDALALSGADFDGDIVNVVNEKTVAEAVIRGAYDRPDPKDYPVRRLPYISIPSPHAKAKKVYPGMDFDTISDSFSNVVGMLSDTAVLVASAQYGIAKDDGYLRNACEWYTILTGLEIDAAKTGDHPDRNPKIEITAEELFRKAEYYSGLTGKEKVIKERNGKPAIKSSENNLSYNESTKKYSISVESYVKFVVQCETSYTEFKNGLKKIRGSGHYTRDGVSYFGEYDKTGNEYKLLKKSGNGTTLLFDGAVARMPDEKDRTSTNLTLLAPAYIEKLIAMNSADEAEEKVKTAADVSELFNVPENKADEEKVRKLSALMQAYNDTRALAEVIRKSEKEKNNAQSEKFAYKISFNQYDSPDSILYARTLMSVSDCFNLAKLGIMKKAGFEPSRMNEYSRAEEESMLKAAEDIREEIIGCEWLKLPKEERPLRIKKILGDDIDDGVIVFLSRFNCHGYNLFARLTESVYSDIKASCINAEIEGASEKKLVSRTTRTNKNGEIEEKNPTSYDAEFYKKVYAQLTREFSDSLSGAESAAVRNKRIADKCRGELKGIGLSDEETVCLAYSRRANDTGRNFFWSGIIDLEMILKSVRKNDERTAEQNA